MNRFLKNAAIVALLATPSGPAFSQELESMENATETQQFVKKRCYRDLKEFSMNS